MRALGDTSDVPKFVSDGGPIVNTSQGKVTSAQVPRGTIVLTFDDGPDPKWTPEVLAVLKKHDIPATFFVVGSNVTRYPEVVAAIHEQGSELGVHSFSHPDLGTKPRWRVDRELAETQLAISGAAGVTTFLLRPPYSSSADAIDNLGWSTVQAAGEDGYITVFTTDDSEDWQRPGVDTIIRNATPKSNEEFGSIVLMHDAGGDRSQTVAALDQWIPLMKAKGFKFATVAGGAKGVIGEVAALPHDRFTGSVLVATLTVATKIVSGLTYLLIIVGVLVGVRLVLMVLYARRHAKRKRRPDFRWGPPVTERKQGQWTYLYFRNGCEYSCGTFDVVFLDNDQVMDAVVRGPGHTYSGNSSSPAGRVPEKTPTTLTVPAQTTPQEQPVAPAPAPGMAA